MVDQGMGAGDVWNTRLSGRQRQRAGLALMEQEEEGMWVVVGRGEPALVVYVRLYEIAVDSVIIEDVFEIVCDMS